jgi:hypothetical protein
VSQFLSRSAGISKIAYRQDRVLRLRRQQNEPISERGWKFFSRAYFLFGSELTHPHRNPDLRKLSNAGDSSFGISTRFSLLKMENRDHSQITEKKSLDLQRERDKLGAKQLFTPLEERELCNTVPSGL